MVGCSTSALVCTSCTRGVQENGAIGLVVGNTSKPRSPRVRFTTSDLVCTFCIRSVEENGAIGLVVLQSTEILGLIILMFRNTFRLRDY